MAHDKERCKEVFAMLSQYLDMELPGDSCEEIERHLAGCPPCVEFADSLRKTVGLCHQFEPRETPPAITEQARQDLLAAYRKLLKGKPEAL
jgi:RNA polymerase sigma-70 factor, ECF subfamily